MDTFAPHIVFQPSTTTCIEVFADEQAYFCVERKLYLTTEKAYSVRETREKIILFSSLLGMMESFSFCLAVKAVKGLAQFLWGKIWKCDIASHYQSDMKHSTKFQKRVLPFVFLMLLFQPKRFSGSFIREKSRSTSELSLPSPPQAIQPC